MPRKKTADGRFAAGGDVGPEDYVPGNPLEKWPDLFRLTVDSGADASVAQYANDETGLGGGKGMLGDQEIANRRWTVFGGVVRPKRFADYTALAAQTASHLVAIQLQIGVQAATGILDLDDPKVIGTGIIDVRGAAVERTPWPVPMDILAPFPMYAEHITVVVDAGVNVAELRNIQYEAVLQYAVAQGELSDQIQYLTKLQAT